MPDGVAEFAFVSDRIVVGEIRNSASKRTLDVLLATIVLVAFLPLLLIIAVLVRLETPGPALFRQRRLGLGGKPFWIFKLRTMRCSADATVRSAIFKDQRVTRVGYWLRRTSIDELPQLFNVIRGDMSLVGPRPHAKEHDETYSKVVPGYFLRFRMRPGLTGLAQISGLRGEVKDSACIARRVEADNEYIESWSFWTDLQIMLKTIPHLVLTRQAY
jgi:putative colanic acid biosynthesis UDP-glucose lipid carrier transferase